MINLTRYICSDRFTKSNTASQSCNEAMQDIAVKAAKLENPCSIEEEAYLLWVMGRLMMLDKINAPKENLFKLHPQGQGVSVFRQRLRKIEFCYLKFEPHGCLPFHDHSNCNGVMCVLEGEVTTSSYDLLEHTLGGVVLQPSAQAWMTAGRISSLSRHRDNIHQVSAGPTGAVVLDVFTLFSPDASCRYMKIIEPESFASLTQAQLINGEGGVS